MKIALIGYGKMGKAIEKIALGRGHDVVLKADSREDLERLGHADAAIEFSQPQAAFENISFCLKKQIPVVCGTTGWLARRSEIERLCAETKGAFLYGSNFSLGVNLFFQLNQNLAQLMQRFQNQYEASIEELHHTQKLDAPSGTAITLAEGIIENSDKTAWKLDKTETKQDLLITAKRIDNLPGTHIVAYKSEVDEIEIKHTAHSREGFALGAVIAAEWLSGKKGIFSMKDVLGFN